MMKMLQVYLISLKNSFASRMTYRTDFFVSSAMIFVSELLIPFMTLLIYGTGGSFPGWSIYEVLLIQGVFMLSKGVANLLFFGVVYSTLSRVREGTYDILMIKPSSVLFLSVATSFEPDSIGTIAGGIIVSGYSLRMLHQPEFPEYLNFLILFLLSLVVLFSFALFMAGSVFKWVGNSRIYEIFDSITAFGNYPRSIFSRPFQAIISYILPIALIGFLPASALLGKPIGGILPTVFVCFVFLFTSLGFWKMMLSKYTSAGG